MTSLLSKPATDTLHLVEPLPGFDDDVDFTLDNIDPDGVLLAMRSVRDPGLRFVLTPAEIFFDGYRPDLGDAVTSALGVDPGSELRYLLLLTITSDLYDATANLRAPIVTTPGSASAVNAVQVVLDDDALSMREPIMPAVPS